MFSQTTEYALQALAYLGGARDEWLEVGEISRALDIPSNYLSKVLGHLAKLGLLESRKGWGGGFRLKKDPSSITLEQVVRPFEGVDYPRSCLFGFKTCSDQQACPLHDYWKRVVSVHKRMLRKTTVADIALSGRRRRRRQSRSPGIRDGKARGSR